MASLAGPPETLAAAIARTIEQWRENQELRLVIDELRTDKDEFSIENRQLEAENEQIRGFNSRLNCENQALKAQIERFHSGMTHMQQLFQQRLTPEQVVRAVVQNCNCTGNISLLGKALQASLDRRHCGPTVIVVREVHSYLTEPVNELPVAPVSEMISAEARFTAAAGDSSHRNFGASEPLVSQIYSSPTLCLPVVPARTSSLSTMVPVKASQAFGIKASR